jgi:hypothetical protein
MEKPIEQATMIPFPPFDYRVFLYFTNNLHDAVKIVNKKEKLGMDQARLKEIADGGGFHIYQRNRAVGYIFLPVNADSNKVTHECYHAVCNIFRWTEASHEEEIFAYHLGYLCQMVVADQKKMLNNRQKRLDNSDEGVYTVLNGIDLPGCNWE